MSTLEKGKQFIVDTLSRNGALTVDALLTCFKDGSKNTPTNCPKILKTVSKNELLDLLCDNPRTFTFKKGYVCLTEIEENLRVKILKEIGDSFMSFSKFKNLCTGRANESYITANGWQQGAIDFLFRNQHLFFRIGENIFKSETDEPVTVTNEDQEAVIFFVKILNEKGSLSALKLAGHLNQASPSIRSIVGSTKQDVFMTFINRNQWIFKVTNDMVDLKSQCIANSLQGMTNPSCKAVEYLKSKFKKDEKKTLVKLAGSLGQADKEVSSIIGGRSPDAIKDFVELHPTMFNLVGDLVSIVNEPVDHTNDFPAPSMKSFEIDSEKIEETKDKDEQGDCAINFDEKEWKNESIRYFVNRLKTKKTQTLIQLAGYIGQASKQVQVIAGKRPAEIADFLREHKSVFQLDDENVSLKEGYIDVPNLVANPPADHWTLDCVFVCDKILELLGYQFKSCLEHILNGYDKESNKVDIIWLEIGSKPYLRLQHNSGCKNIKKLEKVEVVTKAYLRTILEHDEVVSLSLYGYGIRNSLNTMRVTWIGGEACGLTIFNRIHDPDVVDWRDKEIKGITVIEADCHETNSACSYLRNRARQLAEDNHVIVFDYLGKITGSDMPNVVGDARRITCDDFEQIRNLLLEAANHSPDYLITNCCINTEYFELLCEIRLQGIQVIAAVPFLLSSELQSKFL